MIPSSTHGSYLQGMETLLAQPWLWVSVIRTDPTYKEWKPSYYHTRHGNMPRTDPTYKEWKPGSSCDRAQFPIAHGSYLQGMETLLTCRLA